MAFHLFQDEGIHSFVRAQTLEFERINNKQFTKLLIPPVNQSTFEGHLECLQQPTSWATQVEVVAIATFFKVPVYNFTNNNGYFHWEIIKPIKGTIISKELFYDVKPPHHFEFLYWHKAHYDCVVAQGRNRCSDTFPELTGEESSVDIT